MNKEWIQMKRLNDFILLLAFSLLIGCAADTNEASQHESNRIEAIETSAKNQPSDVLTVSIVNQDNEPIGEALLSEDENGVKIDLQVVGILPGVHGFHIHETGRCTAPYFELAGAHFNPDNKAHGFLNPIGPHAGDLPNVVAASDGTINETIITKRVTLKKGEKHSLLNKEGTALIIHSDPDDYLTDPAGNAGDRIACGVINESN